MIYLMRHADAVSDEEDPVRPLSKRGRDQVAKICGILKQEGAFTPAEIWHSPLARAAETAELLARGLKLRCPIVMTPGLLPDDNTGLIAAILATEARNIALVGHEPHLGVLASVMVRGADSTGVYFPFPKAAVMALSLDGGRWRARWLARTP